MTTDKFIVKENILLWDSVDLNEHKFILALILFWWEYTNVDQVFWRHMSNVLNDSDISVIIILLDSLNRKLPIDNTI